MTTPNSTPIPEGYKQDARGRLIPLSTIKPIDLLRDDLVNRLIATALDLGNALTEFRTLAHSEIADFISLSASDYGVEIGGEKGNITLTAYCGSYRIMRAISEVMVFDERIQAAKKLIDECLAEWTKDSPVELKALIDQAFQVNKAGQIDTKQVLQLRRHKILHPKWSLAMDAISNALFVSDTRSYIRFYKRDAKGNYKQINLDLANADTILP